MGAVLYLADPQSLLPLAPVALLGIRGTKPADAGEGRVVGRERRLRSMRAALIDGHRGSRPEAPAVVYVPHADRRTMAAVALAGAGAGDRLRGSTYQRDALSSAAASGSGAAAVFDFDRVTGRAVIAHHKITVGWYYPGVRRRRIGWLADIWLLKHYSINPNRRTIVNNSISR